MPRSEAQKAKRRAMRKLKSQAKSIAPGKARAMIRAIAPKPVHYTLKNKPASASAVPAISGSGDYKGESKAAKKWANLASHAGDFASELFGWGDYHERLKKNSVMGIGCSMSSGGPPSFSRASTTRGWRLQHREYIQEVAGSIPFTSTSFNITPTNGLLFPFLSGLSSYFEEYIIHGLVFYFNTEASEYSSTSLGSVMIATQYDANELPFVGKIQMANYEFCKSANSAVSFMAGVECARDQTPDPILFMNNNEKNGAVRDLNTCYLGVMTVATIGQANTLPVGELWASIDIEFLKPRLGSIIGAPGTFLIGAFGGETSANPFGTAPQINTTNGNQANLFQAMNNVVFNAAPTNASPVGVYWGTNSYLVLPSFLQGHTLAFSINAVGTGFGTNSVILDTVSDVTPTLQTSGSSGTTNQTLWFVQFSNTRAPGTTGLNYVLQFVGPTNTTLTTFLVSGFIQS
jgi:hypothetical protein